MKLSIFPEAQAHPKDKEEKHKSAKKLSAPNKPEILTIKNEEELIETVCKYAWSPFIFSGTRKEENFVSCDILVYDIDEGLRIDEAEKIAQDNGFCCLCLPSPSHTETNHRFRIIIPLAHTISSIEVHAETWRIGAEIFKFADVQCKDACRAYFGCTQTDGFWQEGNLFTPKVPVVKKTDRLEHSSKLIDVNPDSKEFINQIYGEERKMVPECVANFIENAHTGLPGLWTNSLNAFVFSLTLSGVDDTIILEAVEKLAPNSLDSSDIYQIKRSVKDGIKSRT